MAHPSPLGVLLVNLGTPDAPDTASVRRYLAEFLSDPRVIDIHPIARWLLLHLVILRFRPAQSAEAYAKVWGDGGSPLLVHGRALAEGVASELGERCVVELAMRYGRPSIADALSRLEAAGVERIVVFPLYPQWTSSSTGSTLEEVFRLASRRWHVPALTVVPPFYDDAGFVAANVELLRAALFDTSPDHVLFSFHGLPERHVLKGDPTGGQTCLAADDCCARMTAANSGCYRAQCHESARLLAKELHLSEGAWSVAFQSRLGRTPWIRPYTDEVIVELARSGTKRLAVSCSGFVADCLETLEEIGIRAREAFREAGGEELSLVPCVNGDERWIRAAADLVRRAAGD